MAESRRRAADGTFVPGTPPVGSGPNAGPPVGSMDPQSANPPLMGAPLPPVDPLPPSPKTDLFQEYVAGGGYSWYGPLVRALPPHIDEVTRDFGDDLYDRMLLDPQINSCVSILRAAILEDGLHLSPAIEDASDERYDLAVEIHEEAEQMVDDMIDALPDALWDMLGAIAKGNRVAEIKWVDAEARKDDRPLLNVGALKVKPRRATAFVVDPYLNLIGVLGRPPGFPSPFLASWLMDPKNPPPNLVPRSRFSILTHRPEDGDPRGTSILRSAYDPWWRKRQIFPEYLRYLTQFAGPSLWGTTPDKAQPQPQVDADGVPIIGAPLLTPEQVLATALQQIRNGTAGAFPFGTQVNAVPVQPARAQDPFVRAVTDANIEITKSILTQQLATEEGQHQARSAAEVHENVLDTIIRQGKHRVLRMLAKDVLVQWVLYNWGPKAKRLVPKTSLGVTEEHDRSQLITAFASLANATLKLADGSQISVIAPSQLQAMDEMVGLPVREADEVPPSPEEMRAEAERKAQEQQKAMADAAAAAAKQQPQDSAAGAQGQQPGQTSAGDRSGAAKPPPPAQPPAGGPPAVGRAAPGQRGPRTPRAPAPAAPAPNGAARS